MANPTIKISANTGEFKRSLMDLSSFVKRGFGKSNISIFDETTKKMLSGEAERTIGRLANQSSKLKGIAGEYAKKIKDAAGDAQKEYEYRTKLLRVTQRLMAVEKDRERIGDFGKQMKITPTQKVLGGLKQSASALPGVGGLMEGMSGATAAGLAVGGAAIGAGYYGYSRLSAGYDRYSSGLGSRIGLMGRGARDTDMNGSYRHAFSQVGMNEEDLRHSRMQSMDIFGSEGSTQKAVLGRAKFARNYGYDLDSLQGLGSGMRAQTSTRGANRDMMKLQASLMASEIKDAIGPYLETAASMLTDIRQTGLVDSAEVLGLMSHLTRATGNSPERVGSQISGFQSAVQGSSGENNAFFQTAFSKAGIGGKTIGGTQAAIRSGGIFGVNLDDYGGLSKDSKSALTSMGIAGKGTGMADRIGAIMDLADKTFSGKGNESRLAKARFMMPKLGAKNEVESMEMMDQFRSARSSGDLGKIRDFEKRLKSNNGSPEEKMLTNLEAINKSQEGQVQSLQKIREIQEEAMGKQVAPAAMMMSKSLLHIDELIGGIYTGLASIIPGMKTTSQMMDSSLSGESPLSDSQLSEIKQRGGEISATSHVASKRGEVQDELEKMKKQRDFDAKFSPNMAQAEDMRIKELTVQLQNLNTSFGKLIGLSKEHVDVAKEHAAATKKGVKAKARAVPEAVEADKTR